MVNSRPFKQYLLEHCYVYFSKTEYRYVTKVELIYTKDRCSNNYF